MWGDPLHEDQDWPTREGVPWELGTELVSSSLVECVHMRCVSLVCVVGCTCVRLSGKSDQSDSHTELDSN